MATLPKRCVRFPPNEPGHDACVRHCSVRPGTRSVRGCDRQMNSAFESSAGQCGRHSGHFSNRSDLDRSREQDGVDALIGAIVMCCSDPLLKSLKQYGYNVVRLPRSGIRPLQILTRDGSDLDRLGELTTILLAGPVVPETTEQIATNIAGGVVHGFHRGESGHSYRE